jgi:hypothetical protein
MDKGEGSDLSTIRIFPDYAHTVIWFTAGPTTYDAARVSTALATRMRAWEQAYYEGLDDDLAWKSPTLRRDFDEEGTRIAGLFAEELGSEFAVELIGDGGPLRFASSAPASNPEAAAAFAAVAAEWQATLDNVAAMKADGHAGRWSASSNGVDWTPDIP